MNTYSKVEKLYLDNKASFDILEKEFLESFEIPPEILRDTIKRVLVESVVDSGPKSFLLKYKYTVKDRILYSLVMFYFLILSLIPFSKKNNSNIVYDIIFDCWDPYAFDSYYDSIYNKLKLKKIAIFSMLKNYKIKNLFLFDKSNRKIFESEVSKLIFKTQYNKFHKYRAISLVTNINFINFSLRLMRYIALYTTDSYDMKTRFFISAGDNYYNSIRSHIYHKNGVQNIMLIQNGMRVGKNALSSGDLYTHCDYYFGFGEFFIENLYGKIKYKYPVGSFKLYDKSISEKIASKEDSIDIMFIEQLVPFVEMESQYKYSSYKKIVKMLCDFSEQYNNYKIVYRIRPYKLDSYKGDEKIIKEIDEFYAMIKESNIIIDNFSNNSYEVLSKSKIVVYYTSAMGVEALGLNKKVLCCNIDTFDFLLSKKDEIGVLVENSYELFKKKLLFLLTNDNTKVTKEYYLNKKRVFMNLNGNPVKKIVNIIEVE